MGCKVPPNHILESSVQDAFLKATASSSGNEAIPCLRAQQTQDSRL